MIYLFRYLLPLSHRTWWNKVSFFALRSSGNSRIKTTWFLRVMSIKDVDDYVSPQICFHFNCHAFIVLSTPRSFGGSWSKRKISGFQPVEMIIQNHSIIFTKEVIAIHSLSYCLIMSFTVQHKEFQPVIPIR